MYTEPLVKDEHQRDDNDGKWLQELSLQISAGFSAKKAWISMVPIVKNGNLIYAHHSNESISKLQLRKQRKQNTTQQTREGKIQGGPRLSLPNGRQAAHNQQKGGSNFQHGHVRTHDI